MTVYEHDDQGLRVIGYNQGVFFYDPTRTLRAEIYLQPDNTLNLGGIFGGGGSTPGSTSPHTLGDTATHLGLLGDNQAPQFLMRDGSRMLTSPWTAGQAITLPNTGLHLLDTDASHDLIIAPGSDLTADRTLSIVTGDADRTLTLANSGTAVVGTGTATRLAEWSDANTIAASTLIKTGAGVLTLNAGGGYTLTVPATGTAALLATANVFTAAQTINVNSALALLVEQTGVFNNVLAVSTAVGSVGIGIAPVATAKARAFFETINTTDSLVALDGTLKYGTASAANTSRYLYGTRQEVQTSATYSGNITGYMIGSKGAINHYGSGTVDDAWGASFQVANRGTGIIANATGFYIEAPINASTGSLTNVYGLNIAAQTLGTALNYAIYTNAGIVRFGDRVGVLVAAPLGQVHIDQLGAAGAIPVLLLDQGDASEEAIKVSYDAADVDMSIIKLNVTGAPIFGWDESEDKFTLSKGLDVTGMVRGTTGLITTQSVANFSDPPTDAELDAAFGTPATLGRGFVALLDDNDADTDGYIVWTSDASWYYIKATKAV